MINMIKIYITKNYTRFSYVNISEIVDNLFMFNINRFKYVFIDNINSFKKYYNLFNKSTIFLLNNNIRIEIDNVIVYKVEYDIEDCKNVLISKLCRNNNIRKFLFE